MDPTANYRSEVKIDFGRGNEEKMANCTAHVGKRREGGGSMFPEKGDQDYEIQ